MQDKNKWLELNKEMVQERKKAKLLPVSKIKNRKDLKTNDFVSMVSKSTSNNQGVLPYDIKREKTTGKGKLPIRP